jgi:hypothetical protein
MKQMLFLVSADEMRTKYLWLLYSCEMDYVAVVQNTNLPENVTVINIRSTF